MKIYIYALVCPESKEIRYIGKSNNPPKRLYTHIQAARKNYHHLHSSRWIRHLLKKDMKPELKILFEVPKGEDWAVYEMKYIEYYTRKGCDLTNGSKGGEGVRFITKEQEDNAKINRALGFTKEVKKKMSESMKVHWSDQKRREDHIKSMKDSAKKPENFERLMKNTKRTPEREAKRIEGTKKYWADPENRKKQSERMKLLSKDPDWISKREEARNKRYTKKMV